MVHAKILSLKNYILWYSERPYGYEQLKPACLTIGLFERLVGDEFGVDAFPYRIRSNFLPLTNITCTNKPEQDNAEEDAVDYKDGHVGAL